MMVSGDVPSSQLRSLSGLGFDVILDPGSIFPKPLGDRIKLQVELLGYKFRDLGVIMLTRKVFVVHSVSVEGHVNSGVSQGRPVNAKSLTESLAEENPELGSGVPKGDCARNLVVGR